MTVVGDEATATPPFPPQGRIPPTLSVFRSGPISDGGKLPQTATPDRNGEKK